MSNSATAPDVLARIYAQMAVEGLSLLVDLQPDDVVSQSAQDELRQVSGHIRRFAWPIGSDTNLLGNRSGPASG